MLHVVYCGLYTVCYVLCSQPYVLCVRRMDYLKRFKADAEGRIWNTKLFVPLLRRLFHLSGVTELIASPKMSQLLCDTSYDVEGSIDSQILHLLTRYL